jgi:cytochrome P450
MSNNISHFDPYAPELADDPYPIYAALRACPGLARSEERGGFYIASRHSDVHEGLRRTDIFSVENNNVPPTYDPGGPPIPTNVDPPLHDAMRQPFARVFGPAHVAKMEGFDREAAARRLDELAERDSIEFVYDFAIPYVYEAFLAHFGAPLTDLPRFLEWEDRGFRFAATDIKARAYVTNVVRQEVREHMLGYIDARLASGERRDDVIDAIAHAEVESGRPFTREERGRAGEAIFRAGLHTTAAALSNAMVYLSSHLDQRDLLVKDPTLIPSAVEELIRFEPIAYPARTVTAAGEMCGQALVPGDIVLMLIGAAGRDDEQYDDPDAVDFTRLAANRHIAFGSGIHRCLGSHIARLELRVALEEIHKRIPTYRADPDRPPQRTLGQMRGTKELHLLLRESSLIRS